MAVIQESTTRVGFGLFEADLRTEELWKAGRRIKLQSQPFKVLAALVEKPGEVVSREELQVRLWGASASGDFDHSLGTAVNKIREALGDTADNPRFVETLARRGYRWIAPVSILQTVPARAEAGDAVPAEGLPTVEGAPSPGDPVDDHGPPVDSFTGSPRIPLPHAPVRSGVRQSDARLARARKTEAAPGALVVPRRQIVSLGLAAVACFAACLLAAGGWLTGRSRPHEAALLRIDQVTHSGRIAPGMAGMENLPAAVTDGLRVYVPVLEGGQQEGQTIFSAVDVHTGTTKALDVPHAIPSAALGDLSPDGSTMLLRSHLSPESEQPFWTVPVAGGSALRLANVTGHDATWMPDGKGVLYASGNQLLIHHLAEGTSALFATLPGRAFWLRWSPDGSLLRFTLLDPVHHTQQLAEIDAGGHGLRTLLDGWNQPAAECCGVWTGDGRFFVFQSTRKGERDATTDLWRLEGKHAAGPVRVTDGPMDYVAPVAARIGQRIYFLGLESESALRQFDLATQQFNAAPAFLANATRVQYTRDGQWVTWTDMNGHQWRAHADGSETLQLTPDAMQVFLGAWSPDGRRIALMARPPGKAWQIYLVGAEGGAPEPLLDETRNAADPSWSPDGRRIVFGRVSDVMGKEERSRALEILDLETHRTETVPESEGLFSPRWSPDGRFIAALTLDQRKLLLFDTAARHWRTLAETTAADPVWASDSQSVFFHAALVPNQPIFQVAVRDGVLRKIADSTTFTSGATTDYFFCGLTPTGAPIARARTATGNLYTVDLGQSEQEGAAPLRER